MDRRARTTSNSTASTLIGSKSTARIILSRRVVCPVQGHPPTKGTGITLGRVGSLLATLSIRSLTEQQRGTPDVRAIKATPRVSAAGTDDLA
jgi:hypothetical protein